MNDLFKIASRPNFITEIEQFSIFNRWGEVVFEERNVTPETFQGWNGKHGSRDAMQGVYVVMAKVMTISGETELLTGEVVLLR